MTNKKSNDGKGMGPSPRSKRTKTTTGKKRGQVSSAKTANRTTSVGETPSLVEPRISSSEELQRDIAKRAYEMYERRGWNHGQDLSDWLEAEQQVLTQKSF